MKRSGLQIGGGAVAQPADYMGMADFIERQRFILKILYQGLLEISIRGPLQSGVQGLDYDRLIDVGEIARQKDFGIAAAAEASFNPIAIVNYAVFQPELGHDEKK